MSSETQTLTVTVSFNYNNGTPIWNVPAVTVNHGDDDTIQWNLSCTNLPSGTTGRFASNKPIDFVTRKNDVNGATWTGPGPTRVSDTQVTVDDDNRGPSTTKVYFYSVNIETVANGNVTPWTYDPQVENIGG
jgi:hypothetical protein